jgi:ubiquinone/menaquinone biosynthesis C-methylase UbiE
MADSHYIHGTHPDEQERLSRLNELMNRRSLAALALAGGERVLDVGSGLGQFSRVMARAAGNTGRVIAVERSPEQMARAHELARTDSEQALVEFRLGDATDLPLLDEEWGRFDVAHARFLLEHLPDPLSTVAAMVRAVRPGGRIVIEDDDHSVFRIWPEIPETDRIWRAYLATYERIGLDANIGRRLVALLHQAGAKPERNDELFFGACVGDPYFRDYVNNLSGILVGARNEIVATGQVTADEVDRGIAALHAWSQKPEAALWYMVCWAEGRKP